MSLLVKGMKMPTNCDVCPFDNKLYCVAYVPSKDMIYDIADGKPDWCPIIELQPHGRLIDAGATLLEAIRISGPMTGDGWSNWGVYALIERQPTIIPADPEKGGADG